MKKINLLPLSAQKELTLELASRQFLNFWAWIFFSLLLLSALSFFSTFQLNSQINQAEEAIAENQALLKSATNQQLQQQVVALNDEIRKIEAMGICDSKAAGVQKRKKLDTLVRSLSATFAVASSDVSAIDRKGIVEAVRSAVRKSVGEVLKKLQRKPYLPASQRGEPAGRVFTLLDAFPVRYIKGIGLQNQLALIGGDESSLSIAAASIVAKVARDNFMCQIAKKHNNFGWERNKGYGTREHKEALTKFGKTRFHRTDFL